MTAPVSSWTRHGLWCDRCMASTRIERDVFEGGALVATLQGCTRCKSGLCAEPDEDIAVLFADVIDLSGLLAERAAEFFTDVEAQSGQ